MDAISRACRDFVSEGGTIGLPPRFRKVAGTQPFFRSLPKVLVLVVLLAGGAAAISSTGGLTELLSNDPARADYSWLRQGLSNAESLAEQASRGARRTTNLAAANALEQAIRSSRASARSTGTNSIPRNIRSELQDYFPEHVLEEVRWAFPNPYLDLGSLVAWYKSEGGAVTLVDTIVYASRSGLESEYLWAHELTHVMQYEQLGLERFARVYAKRPELLESQARQNARQIVQDIRARRAATAEQ